MKMVYKKISILKKKAEKRKERNKKDMRHIENSKKVNVGPHLRSLQIGILSILLNHILCIQAVVFGNISRKMSLA